MSRNYLKPFRLFNFKFSSHVPHPMVRNFSSLPKRVVVVGAGQMGTGIAISLALSTVLPCSKSTISEVLLLDSLAGQLDKSKDFVASYFYRQVQKSRITEDQKTRLLSLISYSSLNTTHFSLASSNSNLGLDTSSSCSSPTPAVGDEQETKEHRFHIGNSPAVFSPSFNEDFVELSGQDSVSVALGRADYCIEAVNEDYKVKELIFSLLDKQTSPDCILATNTSSCSITKLAAATKRPSQVIGMHFMHPVPHIPLVEVISGLQTSPHTLKVTEGLADVMGKVVSKSLDSPGFISNRILAPYLNEAIFCLSENLATREDIDQIMKIGTNVPMGPLRLADFIGLDTLLGILRVLHEGFGDSKYRPAELLVKYVNAGWVGKKCGKGFYEY